VGARAGCALAAWPSCLECDFFNGSKLNGRKFLAVEKSEVDI
jgi:hypothetical protein